MNEIEELLVKASNPQTYNDWKQLRTRLIHKIQPILLSLSEAAIAQIFESFETKIIKIFNSQNQDEIKYAMLLAALNSYFQREHDTIKPILIYLYKFVQKNDLITARIAIKLLSCISIESIEGSVIFHRLLQFAKSFLQSKKNILNAALILKQAVNFCQREAIHLIYTYSNTFLMLTESDDEFSFKISLKLLKFMLQRTNFSNLSELFGKIKDETSNNFYRIIPVITIAYQTHPFSFTQESLDVIFNHVNDDISENDCNKLYDLIIQMCDNSQFILDANKFINLLIQTKKIDFLNQFITKVHDNKKVDTAPIIKFIQDIGAKYDCTNDKFCPFKLLKTILTYFPEITLNTQSFSICDHFIECLSIRKNILPSQRIKVYSESLVNLHDDYHTIRTAIMLCRIYPECFPNDIIDIISERIKSNVKLFEFVNVELIKTAEIYTSPASLQIIKPAALYSHSKKIRLLGTKCLKPTISLAFSNDINQLLIDSSFKVRRIGIKLFANLAQYNPLFVTTYIQSVANRSITLLSYTQNVKHAAKVASTFPKFFKYCSDALEPFLTMILKAILTILNNNGNGVNFKGDLSEPGIIEIPFFNQSQSNSFYSTQSSQNSSFNSINARKMSMDMLKFSLDSNSDQIPAFAINNNPLNFSSLSSDNIQLEKQNLTHVVHTINHSKSNSSISNTPSSSLIVESQEQLYEKEPLKSKIYLVINEKWIDKRDAHLCRAIAHLGRVAEPFLSEILNLFCHLFETRKNENFLLSLVKSLRILSKSTYNGLNIRLRCPQISVPLSTILSNTQNDKLSISIIKLFGSAFDSISIIQSGIQANSIDPLSMDITDFVFETILSHFSQPSLPLFVSMTMIIEGDPINSAKYIDKIVPVFLLSINKSTTYRDTLFEYLEIIASKCKTEISGLLNQIVPTIHKFIECTSCIKFATSLSYHLKTAFIPAALSLYIPAISKMVSNHEAYFKALIKFITFMTYFQNQPFELFFNKVESETFSRPFLRILSKYITLLAQTTDVCFHQARLLFFTKRFFDPQLLFTLCVYVNLPPEQLKRRFTIIDDSELINDDNAPKYDYLYYKKFITSDQVYSKSKMTSNNSHINASIDNLAQVASKKENDKLNNAQSPHNSKNNSEPRNFRSRKDLLQNGSEKPLLPFSIYSKICNHKNYSSEELDFINIKSYKFEVRSIIPDISPGNSYFQRFTCPTDINIHKWLSSLFQYLVKHSPSNAIRSCISLISFNDDFIHALFPAAFLSCWKCATEKDRNHFSDIIRKILKNNHQTIPLIFQIINLCDRALLPINVENILISENAPSHQMTLLYILKTMVTKKYDIKLVDYAMNIFLKMGFMPSIRGIFNEYKDQFSKLEEAKWHGWLGDWEKALSIYDEENADFHLIINCLAKLGRYKEIYSYSNIFESLDNEQKELVSDSFFVAFSYMHDLDRVAEIISSYEGKWTPYRFILAINYYIRENDFAKAQDLTKKAFKMISSERSSFVSGDQIQTMDILNSAQLFVDCKEVLQIKKMNGNKIWRTRIKGFTRDASMWEQIIRLKNTVVPISSNLPFYIKIISALRKGHHFKLIDTFFTKALMNCEDSNYFLITLKIQWAKGEKALAAFNLRSLNEISKGFTYEEFRNISNFAMPYRTLSRMIRNKYFTEDMQKYLLETYDQPDIKSFLNFLYDCPEYIQEEALMMIHSNYTLDLYQCFEERRKVNLSSPKFIARLNRYTATYTLQMLNSIEDTKDSTQYFLKAIKYNPKDYRNWRGWGYSNMRLYDQLKEIDENDESIRNMINEAAFIEEEVNVSTSDVPLYPSINSNKYSQIYQIQPGSCEPSSLQKTGSFSNKTLVEYIKSIKQLEDPEIDQNTNNSINNYNINNFTHFTNLPNNQCYNENNCYCGADCHEIHSNEFLVIDPDIAKIDSFSVCALNGINGFLKACKLNPDDSMEYLCQILSALFSLSDSDEIPDKIFEEIKSLNPSIIANVTPQLTAQIAHPNIKIREMVRQLLYEIGVTNFEQVFFALFLYSKQEKDQKKTIAIEIMQKLQETNPVKFNDALIFSEGMVKSAVTWFEAWIHAIDTSAKYYKSRKFVESDSVLKQMFHEMKSPKCELDSLFLKMFGNTVIDCYHAFEYHYSMSSSQTNNQAQNNNDHNNSYYSNYNFHYNNNNNYPSHMNSAASNDQLWPKLRMLRLRLREQVDKLSTIVLSKVSEELASKYIIEITLPGVDPDDKIECIEPIMDIMGTQQKPRIVHLRTINGNRRKYLLKGNEDLRLDERLMQFFALINTFFMQNRNTRESGATINRYKVIPLTISSGLIQWVVGADTLHHIIVDVRKYHKSTALQENSIIASICSCDFIHLNSLQRLEVFDEVAETCKADELFEWLWMKAASPQIWMEKSITYSVALSLMSMVGYIIGLGDRHPSNIMIQRDTGSVVHIDFGESFESAINRKVHPEKVPFRLTRVLINAISDGRAGGQFSNTSIDVMRVLRDNIASLVAQLTIFVQEPLNESASWDKNLIKRVTAKLEGKEFNEDPINEYGIENEDPEVEVEDQVDKLIEIASDPTNYIRHYPGWCPFW
ncbi:hypothetical protein TRFO_21428 [Tritrichomonas foetus]|uniref:Uncharacterized protein n=1 Tax=Tritrichomonas foetus TaxID=1144522 RepID=A0A1J4KFB4_9EUKA|nr:hypothetical protein TRFO_21428 [Tritrichomonas foetus]|eukprot:OHT09624.1 hypothetical protein TRFO_21428 [Tritrichomonas foetus]